MSKIQNLKNLKLGLSRVILLCLIISIFTCGIVYSTLPTQPFTINRGVYPGSPSYTVWVEDTEYFCKNAYGVIEQSDTNASSIFNSLFNLDGVEVYIQSGQYNLTAPITATPQSIKIVGEARKQPWEGTSPVPGEGVVLRAATTLTHVLKLGSDDDEYRNIYISDLKIEGEELAGYGFMAYGWNDGTIERVMAENCTSAAFFFDGGGAYPDSNMDVRNCWAGASHDGFSVGSHAEYITFYRCLSYVNDNAGFVIGASGSISLIDCVSMSDEYYGLWINAFSVVHVTNYQCYGGNDNITDNGIYIYMQDYPSTQVSIFGGYIQNCNDNAVKLGTSSSNNTLQIYGLRVNMIQYFALERDNTYGNVTWVGGAMINVGGTIGDIQPGDNIVYVLGYE